MKAKEEDYFALNFAEDLIEVDSLGRFRKTESSEQFLEQDGWRGFFLE